MPATKTELSKKEDFRGDILDRDFPVHFDAKTGAYSYDYADVSAALASELDKIKYYRVSSPKLADVEEELVKHLKAEGPKPPPVKGEITKAAEAEAAKEIEISEIGKSLLNKASRGEALTLNERKIFNKLGKNAYKLVRPKKAQEAKRIYNNIQELANEKGININALQKKNENSRNTSKPAPSFSENEENFRDKLSELKRVTAIIDAYELLESFEEKIKSGTSLTPAEETQKTVAENLLNTTDLTNKGKEIVLLNQKVTNLEEKQKYNNARALLAQIEGTPENQRSAKQLKNLLNAKAIVREYENKHPTAKTAAFVKNINISHADATKYNAKRNVAQATLTELSGKANLTPEEQAKRNSAQKVLNAFTTFKNTNPFRTDKEKEDAEAILKSAPGPVNNTPSLEGAFKLPNKFEGFENNAPKAKGGKRRTCKSKKSKRKTHKRKH